MKKLLAIVVGVSALASVRTANAVPVVPNFTPGLNDLKHRNYQYGN